MNETIAPVQGELSVVCEVPGSRSQTNRALLLAALSSGTSRLQRILISEDTEVFSQGLRELGYTISLDKNQRSFVVEGLGGVLPRQTANIWTQDAGTAARFLLALCAASTGEFHFDGSEQIRNRPIGPLVNALTTLGADFDPPGCTNLPLTVRSCGLSGGHAGNTGNSKSSQFLSAILMAAPLARADVEVSLEGVISRPFVEMTMRMMAHFGVNVERDEDRVIVPAPQQYQPTSFDVEPDASTSSYFFAAAAVTGGRVHVPNIRQSKSIQGDVGFLDVLRQMGCQVEEEPSGTTVVGPKTLQAVDVDMSGISDTFMTLAAIAPFANGTTRISGIAHTRLQESDRIHAMEDGLNRLGVATKSGEGWLEIDSSNPLGTTVSGHGDHRIAMSLALVGLRTQGVVISGAECVRKTCPDYFERLARLAGDPKSQ